VCVGGGGGNAYRARRLSHNGTFQLRRTRRAAPRRTAQIARLLPHMGWPEYGCRPLHVACCILYVACCMLFISCRMLHAATGASSFGAYARARGTCTRGRSCRYGRCRYGGRAHTLSHLRVHTPLATAAAAHNMHSSCTASIAAEQCRLAATTDHDRRHREGAAGGRDEGAPGRLVHRAAAFVQGTPQRRRWALAARMLHRVCCALPAFVWLVATGLCKTHR
jgi:hypothetical protein